MDNNYYFEMEIDGSLHIIESPKGFKKFFKNLKYNEFLSAWEEKKSQGRVFRETKGFVDTKTSNSYLRNHSLHDKIKSFVIKGRLQLLPCQSLMHVY